MRARHPLTTRISDQGLPGRDAGRSNLVCESRPDMSRTAASIPSPSDSTGSTYRRAHASLPLLTPQTITPAMSKRLPSSCVPRQRHSLHSVSASTALATSSARSPGRLRTRRTSWRGPDRARQTLDPGEQAAGCRNPERTATQRRRCHARSSPRRARRRRIGCGHVRGDMGQVSPVRAFAATGPLARCFGTVLDGSVHQAGVKPEAPMATVPLEARGGRRVVPFPDRVLGTGRLWESAV